MSVVRTVRSGKILLAQKGKERSGKSIRLGGNVAGAQHGGQCLVCRRICLLFVTTPSSGAQLACSSPGHWPEYSQNIQHIPLKKHTASVMDEVIIWLTFQPRVCCVEVVCFYNFNHSLSFTVNKIPLSKHKEPFYSFTQKQNTPRDYLQNSRCQSLRHSVSAAPSQGGMYLQGQLVLCFCECVVFVFVLLLIS